MLSNCGVSNVSFSFCISALLTVPIAANAQPPFVGRSDKPIQGATPGPRQDAIRPGRFLVDPPTLENLGFRWYVEGDSNRNATVAVAFRPVGESAWSEALPMLRVHHEIVNQGYEPYRVGNLFAGSVLFLEPGTAYEVRFSMSDPDGGTPEEPKIVRVSTRSEPGTPTTGRTIHARPATGLMAAYRQARPGDVILLHAGTYRGPFKLSRSGEPGRPIVLRGDVDGEAILEGKEIGEGTLVDIDGTDYLTFENLTFRKAYTALRARLEGSEGITVRRCGIEKVVMGIDTQSANSRNWYIADNEIIGINPTWYPRPDEGYMEPGHTGVNVYGQGHVVCYNHITRFSDALAIANFGPPVEDVERHCVAIDFYNNDLSWAQDDTIEADYGCHNVRVYRNRCTNTHTALSTQPFYGGPVYLIRNEAYGITALTFKLNNYPAGIEAYNNTVCCARQGFTPPAIWQNGHFRNNLFIGHRGYAMETGSLTPYSTMDHDGFRRNDPERFLKWIGPHRNVGRYGSIEELHRATGLEANGLEVDYDIFTSASPPEEGRTVEPTDFDLTLRPEASCIDAGIPLPRVTDHFVGTAPDLGCYERGQEIPHYGPRP